MPSLPARPEINHRLLNVVDKATEPWGVKMTGSRSGHQSAARPRSSMAPPDLKAERENRQHP